MSAWQAWRDWRRSRPFWGGLLVIAGGAEILTTTAASLGVTLRVAPAGTGTFAGTVITMILVVSGLLLWFNPAQRVFYSIVAVILSLATFNTINLGGFFAGMLLGILGGALGFAWTRDPGAPGRLLSLAALPLALLIAAAPAQRQAGSRAAQSPAAPWPARSLAARSQAARTLVVAAVPSELTAGAAKLSGLAYGGVVSMPQAAGPPLQMMKFSFSSATLTGRPRLAVHGTGGTVVITASTISFTGHVVLYTTKFSAGLAGTRVTLTPGSPRGLVTRLLGGLAAGRLAAGGIVADHPLALAGAADLPGLTLSVR